MLNRKDQQVVKEWHEAQEKAKEAKQSIESVVQEERHLRDKVVGLFKDVVEGSKNAIELGNGYVLKLTQKYKRTVNKEAVLASMTKMQEANIPVEMLYKISYDLDLAIYRKLSPEQQAIVDETFILKPDTPTVELQLPKK